MSEGTGGQPQRHQRSLVLGRWSTSSERDVWTARRRPASDRGWSWIWYMVLRIIVRHVDITPPIAGAVDAW